MLVTIGISFFNSERTLGDAIRSVFAQTYQDWELLLVDDGSTDASLEIATSVRDPRVRVITDGQNRRLGYRLNQIVDLARGDCVAKLDAHVLMHPQRLEKQMAFLRNHPEVDVVGSHGYAMYASDDWVGSKVVGLRGRHPQPLRTDVRRVMRRTPVTHTSITGRTSWFRRIRYDSTTHRGEDRDMWIRALLLEGTRLARIDEPLVFVSHDGVTLSKTLQGYRQDRRLYLRYGPRLLGWPDTLHFIGMDVLRGLVWRVLDHLQLQKMLIRLRHTPLPNDALRVANEVLANVVDTPVPGMVDRRSINPRTSRCPRAPSQIASKVRAA